MPRSRRWTGILAIFGAAALGTCWLAPARSTPDLEATWPSYRGCVYEHALRLTAGFETAKRARPPVSKACTALRAR